jgi:hypothetical protein
MSGPKRHPQSGPAPGREQSGLSSVVKLLILIALATVGILAVQTWRNADGPATPPEELADREGTRSAQSGDSAEPHESDGPTLNAVETTVRATVASRSAPRTEAFAQPRQLRASPETRHIVTSLTQLVSSPSIRAEQAGQWKAGLAQLVQHGTGAVPAIREFLDQNYDWHFPAGSELGYPTLRAALFEALQQIGGPEAQFLMLETLHSTAAPSDIVQLARLLEEQAPGAFRAEITEAVSGTLAQAAKGELRGWDVGPLFDVLQSYGDSNAASQLEASAPSWSHYAAIALANLPAGEGIPTLIKLAHDPKSGRVSSAATEVLAQVAYQYPEAHSALASLLNSGRIPERSWVLAAAALGGHQYFIRHTATENAPAPIGSGVKTFHIAAYNENFYVAPMSGGMSPEQAAQRLAVIDQLLAQNPSANVERALRDARATIQPGGP